MLAMMPQCHSNPVGHDEVYERSPLEVEQDSDIVATDGVVTLDAVEQSDNVMLESGALSTEPVNSEPVCLASDDDMMSQLNVKARDQMLATKDIPHVEVRHDVMEYSEDATYSGTADCFGSQNAAGTNAEQTAMAVVNDKPLASDLDSIKVEELLHLDRDGIEFDELVQSDYIDGTEFKDIQSMGTARPKVVQAVVGNDKNNSCSLQPGANEHLDDSLHNSSTYPYTLTYQASDHLVSYFPSSSTSAIMPVAVNARGNSFPFQTGLPHPSSVFDQIDMAEKKTIMNLQQESNSHSAHVVKKGRRIKIPITPSAVQIPDRILRPTASMNGDLSLNNHRSLHHGVLTETTPQTGGGEIKEKLGDKVGDIISTSSLVVT